MDRLMVCVKCKEIKEVVGFNRDDPVLECGHIPETVPFDIWDQIAEEVGQEVNKLMATGLTMDQAYDRLLEKPLSEESERIQMLYEEADALNALRFKGQSRRSGD